MGGKFLKEMTLKFSSLLTPWEVFEFEKAMKSEGKSGAMKEVLSNIEQSLFKLKSEGKTFQLDGSNGLNIFVCFPIKNSLYFLSDILSPLCR